MFILVGCIIDFVFLIEKNIKCFKYNEKWINLFVYEIISLAVTMNLFHVVNYRIIESSYLGIAECVYAMVFSYIYGFLLLVTIILKIVRSKGKN